MLMFLVIQLKLKIWLLLLRCIGVIILKNHYTLRIMIFIQGIKVFLSEEKISAIRRGHFKIKNVLSFVPQSFLIFDLSASYLLYLWSIIVLFHAPNALC